MLSPEPGSRGRRSPGGIHCVPQAFQVEAHGAHRYSEPRRRWEGARPAAQKGKPAALRPQAQPNRKAPSPARAEPARCSRFAKNPSETLVRFSLKTRRDRDCREKVEQTEILDSS